MSKFTDPNLETHPLFWHGEASQVSTPYLQESLRPSTLVHLWNPLSKSSLEVAVGTPENQIFGQRPAQLERQQNRKSGRNHCPSHGNTPTHLGRAAAFLLRAEVELKYCLLLLLIFQILDIPPQKQSAVGYRRVQQVQKIVCGMEFWKFHRSSMIQSFEWKYGVCFSKTPHKNFESKTS